MRHLQFVIDWLGVPATVVSIDLFRYSENKFSGDYDLSPDILRVFHKSLSEKIAGIPVASMMPCLYSDAGRFLGDMDHVSLLLC